MSDQPKENKQQQQAPTDHSWIERVNPKFYKNGRSSLGNKIRSGKANQNCGACSDIIDEVFLGNIRPEQVGEEPYLADPKAVDTISTQPFIRDNQIIRSYVSDPRFLEKANHAVLNHESPIDREDPSPPGGSAKKDNKQKESGKLIPLIYLEKSTFATLNADLLAFTFRRNGREDEALSKPGKPIYRPYCEPGSLCGRIVLTLKGQNRGHVLNYYISPDNQVFFFDGQSGEFVNELSPDNYEDYVYHTHFVPADGLYSTYKPKKEPGLFTSPHPFSADEVSEIVGQTSSSSSSSSSSAAIPPSAAIAEETTATIPMDAKQPSASNEGLPPQGAPVKVKEELEQSVDAEMVFHRTRLPKQKKPAAEPHPMAIDLSEINPLSPSPLEQPAETSSSSSSSATLVPQAASIPLPIEPSAATTAQQTDRPMVTARRKNDRKVPLTETSSSSALAASPALPRPASVAPLPIPAQEIIDAFNTLIASANTKEKFKKIFHDAAPLVPYIDWRSLAPAKAIIVKRAVIELPRDKISLAVFAFRALLNRANGKAQIKQIIMDCSPPENCSPLIQHINWPSLAPKKIIAILDVAIELGRPDILGAVLKRYPTIPKDHATRFLILACKDQNSSAVLDILIQKFIYDAKNLYKDKTPSEKNALIQQYVADIVNAISPFNPSERRTALHLVVQLRKTEFVRILLAKGANPNALDRHAQLPDVLLPDLDNPENPAVPIIKDLLTKRRAELAAAASALDSQSSAPDWELANLSLSSSSSASLAAPSALAPSSDESSIFGSWGSHEERPLSFAEIAARPAGYDAKQHTSTSTTPSRTTAALRPTQAQTAAAARRPLAIPLDPQTILQTIKGYIDRNDDPGLTQFLLEHPSARNFYNVKVPGTTSKFLAYAMVKRNPLLLEALLAANQSMPPGEAQRARAGVDFLSRPIRSPYLLPARQTRSAEPLATSSQPAVVRDRHATRRNDEGSLRGDTMPAAQTAPATVLAASQQLFTAINRRHATDIEQLLESKANINQQDGGGRTPLMAAIATADEVITGLVLKYNPDLTKRDRFGKTASYYADLSFGSRHSITGFLIKQEKQPVGRAPVAAPTSLRSSSSSSSSSFLPPPRAGANVPTPMIGTYGAPAPLSAPRAARPLTSPRFDLSSAGVARPQAPAADAGNPASRPGAENPSSDATGQSRDPGQGPG